jgi:hypothetical protein
MVNSYGMAGPAMGGSGIDPQGRSKLHNPVKPHKRGGSCNSGKGRGQVNMPPERVTYRFRITFQKRAADFILHENILKYILQNGKYSTSSVAPKLKKLYIKGMGMRLSLKGKKLICFILGIWFISQAVFSQDDVSHIVPNSLRKPERGEAPRFPSDLVIGELGRGEVSEEAYAFARNTMSALMAGRRDAAVFANFASNLADSFFEEIDSLRPRTFRLGGGRFEPDGCISFLVRFISREESITGELFIRRAEAGEDGGTGTGRWLLDDLVLEERRALVDIRDSYRFNFSPYERFF